MDVQREVGTALILSTAGYLLAAALMILILPLTPGLPPFLDETVLDARYFFPEPGERALYLLGLAWFPVTLYLLMRHRIQLAGAATTALAWLLATAFLAWFLLQFQRDKFVLDVTNYAWMRGALILLMLFMSVVLFREQRKQQQLVHVICAGIIAFVVLACVFGSADPATLHAHFQVIAAPLVQVTAGRTLMVDAGSQYGLWAHFIEPLVYASGGGTLALTGLLAMLTGVALVLIYVAICRWIEAPAVRLATFLCLVALHFFLAKLHVLHHYEAFLEPYFQYWPIRLIAPATVIALMSCPPGRLRQRLLVALLLGFAVAWNFESGLAATGAWIIYLAFLAPGPQTAIIRIGEVIAGVMVALATVTLNLWVRAGELPDPGRFTQAAEIFFRWGYMMSPLPWFHLWQLVLLTYLAALAVAIRRRLAGDTRDAYLAGLATLGALTFHYYLGRSHETLLLSCLYPAILIAWIGVSRSIGQMNWRLPSAPLAGITIFLSVLASSVFLGETPGLIRMTVDRLAIATSPLNHPGANMLSTQPGDFVMILDDASPGIHLATGTLPVANDDYFAMVFREDFERLEKVIAHRKPPGVLLAYRFMQVTPRSAYDARISIVTALERAGYRLVEATPDGQYQYFR